MTKYKVAVIGLGHQSVHDHIPAIKNSDFLILDSICDIYESNVKALAIEHNVPGFTSLDLMLETNSPDIAIVCVPHATYPDIIKKLAIKKIHILKEKPFAVSIEEANEYHKLVKANGIKLMIGVQRKFHPIFQSFNQLKTKIGRVFSIEAKYGVNVDRLDAGWRASIDSAGGGALVDMGYHYVDLLTWYFGLPDSITAKISLGNREEQEYDVEDTASIIFEYFDDKTNHKTIGNLFVSRLYPHTVESIFVLGSKGCIELTRGRIARLDKKGVEIESLERNEKWLSAYVEQLETLVDAIRTNKKDFENCYHHHFKHLAFIEAAYLSERENQTIHPKDIYRKIMPQNIIQ